MNGINPNAMNAMANGTNGVQRPNETSDEMRQKLNSYIYDYFLRNEEFDLARALKNSKLPITTALKNPNQPKTENGEDLKDDIESKKPADLPWAEVPHSASDNSFLMDWFQIFWEMFFAPRKTGPKAPNAAAYLTHQKEQQMMARQNGVPNGMMGNYPAMMRGAQPAMNVAGRGMPNQAVMRNMPTSAQQQMFLRQQQQAAMAQQQAQMGREGGDIDMTDPNMLAQNQFSQYQTQNQKKNLDTYSQNMAQTVRQSMPQNMNGQMMGQQPNMEDFYAGNANPAMRGQMAPNGQQAQGGNHALQDYQMQLMLLEQQNKKRLLMARQEQETVRPGEGQMNGQAGFAPNMSPQGSRSGPSPNPSEQMKRGTPKMGQAGLPGGPNSPMPDGGMARGSPGAMNFNGMEMMQQNMKEGMPMGPGMRPPSSHPNFAGGQVNAAQMEAMRAQQAARMPNGQWQMGPGQPGMPQGGPPGQQMGTPQQRAMPPPQNVPQNGANGRPASPAQSAAAGTPQTANKPAPAKKGKAAKDNKKQPAKKGAATAATPSADADAPPQTPTPATPITPMHASSFTKDGKGPNGQATTGQPNAAVAAPAGQAPQQDMGQLGHFDAMEGLEGHGALNMHFGGMDTGDVLEQFDFDAFLDTGDPDFNLNDMGSFGNYEGLEAGTDA